MFFKLKFDKSSEGCMKKSRIRLKGFIKTFLSVFLYLDIALIFITLLVYMIGGINAGGVLSCFTA